MNARPEPVVLVHGLWLNGLEFFCLSDRLREAGFAPKVFRYSSMHSTLESTAAKLRELLCGVGSTAHVVAHSLGGLVALQTFATDAGLPPGRVLLLGSPVQGSRAAQAISARPFGPQLLGDLAVAAIAKPCQRRWSGTREIGLIAGRRSAGLGRLFASLPQPNDGTICLEETELPGATSRITLDVSHTGMLFSRSVADAIVRFLRQGSFAAG